MSPRLRRYAPVDAMPRGRTVDVRSADGTRIHTEVFGPEDGYPIVLAHGITCAIRVWANQIADLAGDYRVIAYDHRGHGRSDAPQAPRQLRAGLPGRRPRRRPGRHPGARRARRHRRTLDGRHRDHVVVAAVPGTGRPVRRCRRADQHHYRRPAARREAATRAAPAVGQPGACGRTAAQAVGRRAVGARIGAAEPTARRRPCGRTRRGPGDRGLRLRAVRRDPAGGSRRLGQGVGRLAGPETHLAAEPDGADAGHRQPQGPSAAHRRVPPNRRGRTRISRRSWS